MNWGLGQGTQMKMNYEAKSVSLALFIFSALVSLISLFFSVLFTLESVLYIVLAQLRGWRSLRANKASPV